MMDSPAHCGLDDISSLALALLARLAETPPMTGRILSPPRICRRTHRPGRMVAAQFFRPGVEALESRVQPAVSITLNSQLLNTSFAGVGFTENAVATFIAFVNGVQDLNGADFQAQIDWGDGKSSVGHVAPAQILAGSSFLVKG